MLPELEYLNVDSFLVLDKWKVKIFDKLIISIFATENYLIHIFVDGHVSRSHEETDWYFVSDLHFKSFLCSIYCLRIYKHDNQLEITTKNEVPLKLTLKPRNKVFIKWKFLSPSHFVVFLLSCFFFLTSYTQTHHYLSHDISRLLKKLIINFLTRKYLNILSLFYKWRAYVCVWCVSSILYVYIYI